MKAVLLLSLVFAAATASAQARRIVRHVSAGHRTIVVKKPVPAPQATHRNCSGRNCR